jgi:hypothetical protein
MNALKIQQERTIAVGNSRQNARGDVLGAGRTDCNDTRSGYDGLL